MFTIPIYPRLQAITSKSTSFIHGLLLIIIDFLAIKIGRSKLHFLNKLARSSTTTSSLALASDAPLEAYQGLQRSFVPFAPKSVRSTLL